MNWLRPKRTHVAKKGTYRPMNGNLERVRPDGSRFTRPTVGKRRAANRAANRNRRAAARLNRR